MKAQFKKFSSGFLVCTLASLGGFSAHAEDTEIFFNSSYNTDIQPNVVFIIDNSGSMSNMDGGTTTRMERVKSAMTSLLGGLSNVNVGLMQYSMPGGPVLFPVTAIDEQLVKPQTLSLSLASGSDDAEQASGGAMTLTNKTLAVTTRNTSGGGSLTTRVTASSDDAEERLGTGLLSNLTSASLELAFDDFSTSLEQSVGLIFRNQTIPAGAVILSATLEFTIQAETGSSMLNDPLNLAITGQMGASSISAFSNLNNVSSRTKTTASTTWNISGNTPPVNEPMTTPNLAAVIQEIVNQGTWSSGSDIALFLQRPTGDTTTGERIFASYDQAAAQAPQLTVTWEMPTTSTTQTVGLRYSEVGVPRGATITSATLEFQTAADNSGAATYTIYGEDVANSAAFTTASSNLTGRTSTGTTVSWTPGVWRYNETHSTVDNNVDLKSVLQEIVDRSDWCGGNALSLFISGGGSRIARAYEDSPGSAPKLKITYDPNTIPSGGGCMATTLSYRVNANNNDSRGRTSGSSNDVINDTNLPMGVSGSNNIVTGFRFTNVQLPKNATITNAYLELTAATNQSGTSDLDIAVHTTDNSSVLCSSGGGCTKLKDRNASTAIDWNPVPAFTTNVTYKTPDLTSLVQTMVNRSGWVAGNAMTFLVRGSGTREVIAFEHAQGGTAAARLVVRYAANTTSTGGTTRDALISLINDMQPLTATPIVDVLYEAARYYRGEGLTWGDRRYHAGFINYQGIDNIIKELTISHPDSYTGGTVYYPSGCSETNLSSTNCKEQEIQGSPTYISPITSQCQTNHIVLLTDGEPTQNGSASLVRTMTGKTSCTRTGDYACGPELAEYLAENDQSPLDGDQKVKTHTVAFNLADASGFLDEISDAGDGDDTKTSTTYKASSAAQLQQAFEQIAGDIMKSVDTTFVSPGVTVNTFNRLTHRNEIYYALFRPQTSPSWPGNLKRYAINSNGEILDSTGVTAINEDTGFFKDASEDSDTGSYTATSIWSSSPDGNNVELGGAASKLPACASRNVYTNTAITKAMLGISAEADSYRTNLINWARGLDPATGTERNRLADPLHSVPHLVTYGGTDDDPDISIYYGDNEGFLHAINAETGVEQFVFIPEALLPRLNTLYVNNSANDHPYGMDGPINSWTYDVDKDLQIEPADGDRAYVFAGMRRGGRNYYALDATNRSAPSLQWTIQGGTGDFAELGQTWSKPIKTKINLSGTITDVLIFGGGYDPDQDNVNVITADDVGRAIFIVNATTGAKLWSVGPTSSHNLTKSDMIYSIPATVRVLDTNNDGLADQMYAGDVGGQLWRFDITNGNSAAQLVTGAVIADISGTTEDSARRFYHEPDVSVIIENNRRKLAIVIGSGYHAHPLSELTTDRVYMIKQSNVTSAPEDGTDSGNDPDYVELTEANLYNATNNLIGEGSTSQQAAALIDLAAASGWYITLEDEGEKMLSTPLSISGEVFFTTYAPTANVNGCNPTNGTSRLYRVSSLDATPTDNSDDVEGLTKGDRSETLKTIGLPPDPVRLRISDDAGTQDVLCVGTECQTISGNRALIKTYWYSE